MASFNNGSGTPGPKLRRTQSVNKAEQISRDEKKERSKQPDKPVHRPTDSLFSSTSGYSNYRGFFNLCIVLLILSNGRVALENIMKYGILVSPNQWIQSLIIEPSHWPVILLILGGNIFIFISFGLEQLLSRNVLKSHVGLRLQTINLVGVIVIPAIIVWSKAMHPLGASMALGMFSTLCLKLVSYTMVNEWCRDARPCPGAAYRRQSFSFNYADAVCEKPESTLVTYPNNLNLKDLYYFILAPTLCYELNFPRTTRIRKRFLIKRALEMLFLSQLIIALIQQWMVPTIQNSMMPFKEMDYSRMLERLLKLTIPNILIWLISFYCLFHSSMNFSGEILRFADREFYKDWWNAETIQTFWSKWNIPVHRWCLRHMYIPLLKKGYDKLYASIFVFLVSAFFHEYLVSVPLNMFRVWAFMGMILQIPLAIFVQNFLQGKYANMAMWLSLIIGQPLAILMYFHDYYVMHFEI